MVREVSWVAACGVVAIAACGSVRSDDPFASASASGMAEGTGIGSGPDGGTEGDSATEGSGPSEGGRASEGGGDKLDVGFDTAGPTPGCHEGEDCGGCTAVDILFVIDNSTSMGSYQPALAAVAPDFADAIFASLPPNTDIHVGVTTSSFFGGSGGTSPGETNCSPYYEGAGLTGRDDLYQWYWTPDAMPYGENGAQGRLREHEGLTYYAASSDDDPSALKAWLAGNIRAVGESGSVWEMVAAGAAYPFHEANAAHNAGFLRDEGAVLARYILLRELARGGGGIVYSAFDPELDRKVAIKLIHSGTGDSAQESRFRLLREAQAMARVDHPNVIPVHDVGTYAPQDLRIDDGRKADIPERGVFVVMELADGTNLREWLAMQPRSWREVVAVFRDAAAGLVAAHGAGLVHRDFKPSNVMIGADGRVRVLDFGLARAVGSSTDGRQRRRTDGDDSLTTPITGHGVVVGTPAYMSPEQHRGVAVDERSDQYSFCAALYEGVYGRLPFPQRTLAELREAKEAGVFARRPDPRVPRWLDRLLATGLAPRPEDRHASMLVLHEELGRNRGRALRFGAVSIVGLGTIGAVWVGASDDPCAGLERELVGIWDADTRARVEAAFLDTGMSYAEQTARTVGDELDRYVARWIDTRVRVCEAGFAEGGAKTAETARAMLCLDRRLTRVGGLTQLFAGADAKIVESAAAAVADLPPIETCAQRHGGADAIAAAPSDEELLAVEAEIAQSVALVHAVRYDAALVHARAAVEMAERVGEPRVLGRAFDQLARVHGSRAEFEEAENAARRAVEAAERGLDGELAVACLVRLANAVGVGLSRYGEGLQLLDLAAARAEGLGLDDVTRRQVIFMRARARARRAVREVARRSAGGARDRGGIGGGAPDGDCGSAQQHRRRVRSLGRLPEGVELLRARAGKAARARGRAPRRRQCARQRRDHAVERGAVRRCREDAAGGARGFCGRAR